MNFGILISPYFYRYIHEIWSKRDTVWVSETQNGNDITSVYSRTCVFLYLVTFKTNKILSCHGNRDHRISQLAQFFFYFYGGEIFMWWLFSNKKIKIQDCSKSILFQFIFDEIWPRLMVISKKIRQLWDFHMVCLFLPKMDIIGNPYQIENKDFFSMTKIGEFFLRNWGGIKRYPFVGRHFETLFTIPVF